MKLTIDDQSFEPTELLMIMEADNNVSALISPGITVEYALRMLGTLNNHVLQIFAESNPEIKDQLYDAFNYMASNVLANFDPERELNPDMDPVEMMLAEDEAINAKYDMMNREARRANKRKFDKVKKNYAKKVREVPKV